MTRKNTQKTRKTSHTPQSLTASGWLKPQRWQISKTEAAQALKIPVNRIVKVSPKQHQVIVVYLNQKGQNAVPLSATDYLPDGNKRRSPQLPVVETSKS